VSAAIVGSNQSIFNLGVIRSLENSGELRNAYNAIYNQYGGQITTLNNSGLMSGDATGISNLGSVGTITNSGSISANMIALNNGADVISGQNVRGSIGSFINTTTGNINGGVYGVNNYGGVITSFTNNGSIAGDTSGMRNSGSIDTLTNSGNIAGSNGYGIENRRTTDFETHVTYIGSIQNLNNIGVISATNTIGEYAFGIANSSEIANLTNLGFITADGIGAYGIYSEGLIANLSNSGTIRATSSTSEAVGVYSVLPLGILNNTGLISATATGGYAAGVLNDSNTMGALTNSGSISATSTSGGASGIINTGDIANLTNTGSGTITATSTSGSAYGISNNGTVGTLSNSGSISAAGVTKAAIFNNGVINTLTNSGLITGDVSVTCDVGSVPCGSNSISSGRINTLNNSGVINGDVFLWMDAPTPGALPSIGTFNNSGSINSLYLQYLTGEGVAIEAVNNTGYINNGIYINFIGSDTQAGIGTLVNSGSIDGGIHINWIASPYLSSAGIKSFINTGAVTGGVDISNVYYFGQAQSGIESLTNLGSISGGIAVSSIYSGSTGIVTLNNSQGGNSSSASSTPLTYSGNLPTNYNIGIASSTHYGQLAVSSPVGAITNFGIYGTPFLTSRTYAGVLSNNVTVSNVQATYDNMSLALVNNASTNAWDLTFTGASLMGTQQSLVNTANALAPVYAMQNAVLVNSFTYDCTLFDVNNICLSVGGRNTQVSAANGLNNTSALLIAAYRPHPNYRIGAYADQNLSVNNAGSTVNLSNSTPLIGVFGAWTQNQEGTGAEVRVSAAYGQKDATITRQVVGLSEPGSRSSTLNSQGAQVTAKYGFGVMDKVIVSPYVGVRYTQNNMGGYTENTSNTVTSPLTYGALNTNATTALAGVGASYKVIPAVTTFASAGVETDTNTSNGTYSATGINGLTPVNFNPNPVRTRPTATVGAYYDIVKNQRFGVTGIYRQEAYQAVSSTTVMATYTIGL
jgi:hypothetical protein